MSVMYVFIEVFYTAIFGEMSTMYKTTYFSFIGFSSVWMCFIGGVIGMILGKYNRIPILKDLNLFWKSIIGCVMITIIELVVGYILNIRLKFHIWDYSHYPINFLGQISLLRSIGWFFICPLVFWFNQMVLHMVYDYKKPESLFSMYLKTLLLKR
jgi:uncharacterized membrane protein